MSTRELRVTFTGGERAQLELARIAGKLGNGKVLRVGFLEGARYPDGTPVAQVAFWNEFGTRTAPVRSFFRDMIAKCSPRWGAAIAANLRATNFDGDVTLQRMGVGIQDQLTRSIVDFTTPGNAPYTIQQKGFDKPLIDTGVMQRSVGFDIQNPRT